MSRDYWTCEHCGFNFDHGEAHICEEKMRKEQDSKTLNLIEAHERYILRFADLHDISFDEAKDHEVVKLHLQFCKDLQRNFESYHNLQREIYRSNLHPNPQIIY